MNEMRCFGKSIPDPDLRRVLDLLYNQWFKQWKNVQTEEEFDQAAAAWMEIMEDCGYEKFPAVHGLGLVLIYEVEARLHHGYTQVTRDKVESCIRGKISCQNDRNKVL